MKIASATQSGQAKWVLFDIINRRNIALLYPKLEWEQFRTKGLSSAKLFSVTCAVGGEVPLAATQHIYPMRLIRKYIGHLKH